MTEDRQAPQEGRHRQHHRRLRGRAVQRARRASATPRWPASTPCSASTPGMVPVAVAATATGSVLLMSTLTSAIALTMGGILDCDRLHRRPGHPGRVHDVPPRWRADGRPGRAEAGQGRQLRLERGDDRLRDGRGHPHHGRQVRRHLRLRPDDVLEQGRQGRSTSCSTRGTGTTPRPSSASERSWPPSR